MHFLFNSATMLILTEFEQQLKHFYISGPVLDYVELFPQNEKSLP